MRRKIFEKILKYSFKDVGRKRQLRNFLLRDIFFNTLEELSLRFGVNITTVYDIGANKGEWAAEASKYLSGSEFYLFEANSTHIKSLERSGFDFFITALSNKVGSREFFSTGGTGDSFYKELTPHFGNLEDIIYRAHRILHENVEARVVETNTLNNLVRSKGLKIPQLIKIDTQGSELDILRGSTDFLDKVAFVYMECPVDEHNEGSPKFDDYIYFMKHNGFVPSEVGEIHRRSIDAKFVQLDILSYNAKLLTS